MVHVIVCTGGGAGLPPGSQVSPHWNLGLMPPLAWAAGTAVKLVVVVFPLAGWAGVAARAGVATAAAPPSPPPAAAMAMAVQASALLKRGIDGPRSLSVSWCGPWEPRDARTVGRRTETALKRKGPGPCRAPGPADKVAAACLLVPP